MIRAALMFVALSTTAPASAGQSCLAEVGKVRAQAYADMCRFFSTATHPPCNVANQCSVMQAAIDQTCTDKAKCVVPTVAGIWKCSDDRCSNYSFTPARATKRSRG